jgi:UDP-glucose 4-epimerase
LGTPEVATYLVTGAAGFIGSNIVEELLARGAEVRALDNFSTGRRANLEPFRDRLELFEGNLNDADLVARAVMGVDYVLHQAALPSVPRSVTDPLASHEANATGTLKVLIAARDAGVKRLVFASSSSVYGDSPELPKHEEMPTRPRSPYAVNKLAGEEYCKVFSGVYGFPAVALRYFNVFGPRQDPASQYAAVIPAFITAALRGQRPVVHGDGLQTRDFTYVQNVVDANLLACDAPEAAGEAINIACGQRISLLELLQQIGRITGRHIEPRFDPARPGDVKHSLASIQKAERLLGFTPSVTFDQGLERTIEYFRTQAEAR